jgi:AAT family amino acid transporter
MLLTYVVWKLVQKTKIVKLDEVDLETNRYDAKIDFRLLAEGWKAKVKNASSWLF